ncbi:MAG: hypothetical protein EPO46_12075 [Lysobacter sp.]|nr:MAG: hypothetical protein EPO46_12075 [Lysobacter sp.]
MQASLFMQNLIVALAVIASALYIVLTRLPKPARRLRGRLALWLVDSSLPALQRLGRRIAPAPVNPPCGGCDGCGPSG